MPGPMQNVSAGEPILPHITAEWFNQTLPDAGTDRGGKPRPNFIQTWYIFELLAASKCPEPTAAKIFYLRDYRENEAASQIKTYASLEVEDPLCMGEPLEAGDKGYCFYQHGRYWLGPYPCP